MNQLRLAAAASGFSVLVAAVVVAASAAGVFVLWMLYHMVSAVPQ